MGDDSSPETDTEDEQREQIEVDASGYHDETDPVARGGRSGLLAMRFDELLGFIGLTFLLGLAAEVGKRVGRDLTRSW